MITRDEQITRIINIMELLSLDELSEALDEINCEDFEVARDVLTNLSHASLTRFANIVTNLALYSQRVDSVVLVYEGNREVVHVVSGSLDETSIVVKFVESDEECEFERGADGWYEINDASARYTFEKVSN